MNPELAETSFYVSLSIKYGPLEYACPVFANLPLYLSDSIERVQRRALRIIFPGVQYGDALRMANIQSLQDRRLFMCKRFISTLKPENPVYNLVRSRIYKSQSNYTLRPKSLTTHSTATNRFGDFVTNKHATALNRNT